MAYVTSKLSEAPGPIVATTDYLSDVPDQIRQFLPNPFASLDADPLDNRRVTKSSYGCRHPYPALRYMRRHPYRERRKHIVGRDNSGHAWGESIGGRMTRAAMSTGAGSRSRCGRAFIKPKTFSNKFRAKW